MNQRFAGGASTTSDTDDYFIDQEREYGVSSNATNLYIVEFED